ncbi:hypothetical protein STEG23_017243 [Scotinomys teguina]
MYDKALLASVGATFPNLEQCPKGWEPRYPKKDSGIFTKHGYSSQAKRSQKHTQYTGSVPCKQREDEQKLKAVRFGYLLPAPLQTRFVERTGIQKGDPSLAQPSSEKLPPVADGDKYRNRQPDNVQKVRDLGTLSPQMDVFIKIFPTGLRELCGRGSRKSVKVRGDGGQQEKENKT